MAVAAATAAAAVSADLIFGPETAQAQSVTSNANYSTTVEASGAFGTSNFEAAGQNADGFPAFGVVAFNASNFTSFAAAGVATTATITAPEFVSTSASTLTHAGSVLNFYFGQNPQTGTGLGDYDVTNEPGGFDAANFSADLVGSVTYANTANKVDTITLTLSASDVTYIDTVLSNTSSGKTTTAGSFEFFSVATTNTSSGRYDGNFAATPATLTLNAGAGNGTPTGLLTFDPTATAGGTASTMFTTATTVTNFIDSGTKADVAYADGNAVTFGDAGVGPVVVQAAGVNPSAGSVTNTSGTYTFSGGAINGSTGLTKTGAGTLVLSVPNTYSGGTTIGGGIVQVAADADLGTGGITLSGGELQVTSSITSAKSVTTSAASTIDTGANSVTFTGLASGTGALTKLGSGNLTLSPFNSSVGSITLSAGSVTLDNTRTSSYVNLGSTGVASTITGTLNVGTTAANVIQVEPIAGSTIGGTGSIPDRPGQRHQPVRGRHVHHLDHDRRDHRRQR